jgi:hypothetical protein
MRCDAGIIALVVTQPTVGQDRVQSISASRIVASRVYLWPLVQESKSCVVYGEARG